MCVPCAPILKSGARESDYRGSANIKFTISINGGALVHEISRVIYANLIKRNFLVLSVADYSRSSIRFFSSRFINALGAL